MTDGGEIDRWLELAADTHGSPAFVYFSDLVSERIAALHRAFDHAFDLSFAVKSNPNPGLLKWLRGQIGHLDVSSIGEFRLALAAGWDPASISFTGPAKREPELHEAIAGRVGLLVVESLREARLADTIASLLGRKQSILVRIAPNHVPKGFGDQMAGRPSPFGIDEDEAGHALAEIQGLAALHMAGLHIYAGTQCLKPAAIVELYRGFIALFRRLCQRHAIAPERLIFGSGMGVAYHEQDTPLDLAQIAREIGADLQALRREPLFTATRPTLELGRYLTAEAGYFVTRVISIKQSRGARIAICDGGMNNHLPASGHFGMVIRRNYKMHKVGGGEGSEPVDVVGPLCTSIDRLASKIDLPHLEEGDLIAVHNSGAYGLTASPFHFIGHRPPSEVMVCDGVLRDVTRFFDDVPVQVQMSHATFPSLTEHA